MYVNERAGGFLLPPVFVLCPLLWGEKEGFMNTPGISREFSTGELLRFAAPSIVMMLFLSMYTIVDGFFISRFVGTAALSATNIVYPLIGFFLAVGIMFATGGSAVVAAEMGRGETGRPAATSPQWCSRRWASVCWRGQPA